MSPRRILRPRALTVIYHLGFLLAGLAFTFWLPTTTVEELLGWGFYVWNSFFLFGPLIGAVGAFRRKFREELSGIPFTVTALVVYSLALWSRVDTSNSPGATAGVALVFMSAAIGLGGHGWELIRVTRLADEIDRRLKDG